MPSKEYHEGRDMERHKPLHEVLINALGLDSIDPDGSTQTKGDIIGIKDKKVIPISVKNASGMNTQVHLPTLNSFSEQVSMPDTIKDKLERFLGTNDSQVWNSWTREDIILDNYEQSHQRLKSAHIDNWQEVESWFNCSNLDISKQLIQYLKKDSVPVVYLVWVNKKTKLYQVVDVNQLIDWIGKECIWVTTPGQTVLRCHKISENSKPIFTLQMKGSKIKGKPGWYDHNPQFHLYPNWPSDLILYQGTLNEKVPSP